MILGASILLKVTITALLTVIVTRLLRKSRAAVRHLLLASGFVALLLLPIASLVTPTVNVNVPAAVQEALSPLDGEVVTENVVTASAKSGRAEVVQSTSRSWPGVTVVLFLIWIAGAAAFLLPVLLGLSQVRAIRRAALPWREGRAVADALAADARIRRRVDLLIHESLPGPMTCGVLHPAIVLPADAKAWPAEDLHRAIVHELEHVRRGDWVSQCLARIVTACYWFHPIVWMAWRQLSLEAERACDDAVLAASEATAYADQLVGLAQRLSTASNHPQLAMADRRDLATRVGAVLDNRQRRGRAGGLWVAGACVVAALLVAAISPIRIAVSAQTAPTQAAPQGPKKKYDAATIKQCEAEEVPTGARGAAGGTNATWSPGRFFVPCVTTEQLIYLAYASYGAREDERLVNDDFGTASNPVKVRGGPAWVHSLGDKYSIEAVAEGANERTVLMGEMLQSLLEDRFKLKLHRDTEEVPLFAMTVGKGGFKLKPMKEGDCDPTAPAGVPAPGGKPKCGNLNMMSDGVTTRWTWGSGTVSSLAGLLSRELGTHIVDKTGITDKFIYVFEFQRGEDAFTKEASIIASLDERLGLKLEKTKGPRGFLAIDSIERPKPDSPFSFAIAPVRAQGPSGK
jgi:uncharacterized protein (TIGR03435 family)